MAGNDTTVRFKADISQLKSQMQAAERQIKLVNSEFKAATAGMDDWTKSADGLTAKTKQLSSVLEGQNKKLELMEKELQATVSAYGENSAAADRVRIKINEQKAAIAKTESQLKTYEQKLTDLTTGMNDAADGSQEFISATDKLKDSISDQESKLESLKKHYSDLVLEGKGVSDEAEETARQIKELSGELDENKSKLAEADKAADEFDDSLTEMDDAAEKASDGFTVFKGALSDLVADGIRATIGALKDLAKETFEVGSNFEAAMSQVAAVSGANGDELDALTEKAEEMGAKTKFSATESADAFNYMAMAGWKTEDMLDGIEGIMNLAAASGSDLATASDIVTDALTAMGYSAKDAGKLADVMAAASSNANTNVEMMGKTFQYAAPIVGALGYNMEDTAVAIGLMANSGIKADKAGTALRSILTRLSAPPKECAEAMEELGISLTDDEGNMKEFSQVMEELRDSFDGLSESEKTSYAKHIAGQEAMSGLLSIVNASEEDYVKLSKAIDNSAGAAESMANTMNDNVSGAITLLKSKIEGIMIKLFNRAKDSMRNGIDTVSDALDRVDWDKAGDAIGDIAKKAADLFAYAVNNSDRIISIIKAIGTAIGIIFVTGKITSFASAIGTVITALSSAKSGTEALSAVTKILGINMSALPVAVLVASMAALYGYMSKTEKQFEANAEAAYGLTEEEKELIDTIDKSAEAIQRANDARKETGENIDLEYGKISDLKDQYNALIDENGNVKEGYEDLADELLGELAQGLNLTIDELKENIDQNGKLGASIDELIQKKKDEAKLSAFESDYDDAIKNELKYFQELKAAKEASKNAQEDLNEAQEEYNKAVAELEKYGSAGAVVPWDVSMQAGQAQKNLEAAKATYDELNGKVTEAAANWGSAQSLIENYQNAMAASTEGNADKMNDALISMQYGLKNYTTASEKELYDQYRNTKKDLEDIEQLFAEGKVSEELVKDYRKANKLAGAELDKWVLKNKAAGNNSINELNGALSNGIPKVTVTSGELGVGSQLALFEGLGDWRDIAERKAGDYVDALDDNKADAAANGGKLAKAAANGAEGEKGAFIDAADNAGNAYDNTLQSFNAALNVTGANAAGLAAEGAKSQIGEFTNAAEDSATEYKNTIDSHASDYKKSGEAAAEKTADGATSKIGEFKTSGDKAADQYTITIDSKSGRFKVTGQQMADSTASGAEDEASAMQSPAEKAVSEFADTIENNKEQAYSAGESLASEAVSGADNKAGEAENSGKNLAQGFINGIGSLIQKAKEKAAELTNAALSTIDKTMNAQSPSRVTFQSGTYFSQGFINGIQSLKTGVVIAAANISKNAIKSLKDAQEEGSPSKLTYKSGKNFTQGYINGIASLEKQLVKTSQNLVVTVIKQLKKVNDYNFDEVADAASNKFSTAISKKLTYASGWMQYKNDNMLADFDKTISSLQKKSDEEVAALQKSSNKVQTQMQKDHDAYVKQLTKQSEEAQKGISKSSQAEQKRLQKEIDKIKSIASKDRSDEDNANLNKYQKQLTKEKEREKKQLKSIQDSSNKQIETAKKQLEKELKAEQTTLEKGTKIIQNSYNKQISKQQTMKENYQKASSAMMTEFTAAMNDYQTAAQELIDSTMEGITTKYNAQYDKLLNKQNNLIEKLKDAGDVFGLDNANLMTTEDLEAQTKQITRYADKLKKIKSKVSDELFEQIQGYDMKDGEAFIDRLLKMSKQELDSFNKAYTDKINAADSLAQGIYKKDFNKVASDYKKEVNDAFDGLDKDLEEIGKQCFNGFISGLTTNTKYMNTQIKTFVNGMIATFKKDLGIKSPSKVTKQLGAYTAEGFAVGISTNSDKVTAAIDKTIAKAEQSFDWGRLSLIDGFEEAMAEFESQARDKLSSTIDAIGTTYQTKASEIFTKQDALAKTLKTSGSVFNLNQINMMTTKDLQAQTEQITRYANKLANIKDKVSETLFEQITSYDMQDGEEFIDRLLSMSAKELNAFNKAYTDKLAASDKLAQKVYAKELDKVAQDYNKEIEKAFNGLDDELSTIGKQCLSGFINGLTKDSKYISTSVDKMIDDMIATFKKKLGIKSPSKVTKKLGGYTAEGFADGIEQNADMVTKAIDSIVASVENSFDWSRLSLIDGFTDAIAEFESEAKDVLSTTISDIGDTYQTKFNEILNKQENLAKSFKSTGDLFSLNAANVMTVNDINAQIKDIQTYATRLQQIKGKVSSALFEQITSYNVKEGSAFIDRLLSMSETELKAYSAAYDKKLSLSEQLSESLYKSDLDKVARQYDTAIENAFSNLPAELTKMGTQAMQGFLNGLGGDAKYFTDDVKKIVNNLVGAFKKELGIHSPSKVMQEIGEYTGEGFTDGLLSMIAAVKDAAEEMSDALTSALDWQGDIMGARGTLKQAAGATGLNRSVGTFDGANTQIINFNQTNNSPKALDRLTLYRQTNNMLFSAKVRLSDV